MAIITIDSVVLPNPSALSVTKQDLDSPDSTRNEVGYLQRYRIRQGVYKVSLTFNAKTAVEIEDIESTLTPSMISVTFPDSGGMVTKDMYVGDRSKSIVLYSNGDFNTMRWNLSFDLIEY